MLIKCALVFAGLVTACGSSAQNTQAPASRVRDTVVTYAEQMPAPGYDYDDYLSKNIHYPESALKNNVHGKVVVKFIVNQDGNISDCSIVRSVSHELDEEALRDVQSLPPWKPGFENGKAVKVYYAVPVSFNLPVVVVKKDSVVSDPPAVPDKRPSTKYDLVKFIGENIQYPHLAYKQGKQGVVRTKFDVNEDGSISNCVIVDSVCQDLDDEALRIIKILPNWEPGTVNGKVAKTSIILPITFTYYKKNELYPRDRKVKNTTANGLNYRR